MSKSVSNPSPNEGEAIVYTLAITNNGPADATNVVLTDTLPISVTYVSNSTGLGSFDSGTGEWLVGTLANLQSVTLLITVTVDAGTSGQIITNTTDGLSADQNDPNTSNNTGSVAITVTRADLSVSKVVNQPTPNEGDTIVYTVAVTNNGPSNATGVQLADLLPPGVTYASSGVSQGVYSNLTGLWNIGNLSNSLSATLLITATVNNGTAGQTITNTASIIASDQGDPNPGNNSASAGITVADAELGLSKVVDNNTPGENDSIVYTVTVNNNGPSNATGLIISDTLPVNLTFVSSSTTQGDYNAGTGLWTVGSLSNGNSATLLITATVNPGTAGTAITNVAEISAVDQADSNASNNIAREVIGVGGTDLAVSKSVNNANPDQGSTIVYTLVITNNGPISTAGVVLTDTLPAQVTFGSASATQGSYNSSTGVWTVGSLNNMATATLLITATVNNGTAGQTITNVTNGLTAANPDPDSSNNVDSVAVIVTGADLTVIKTVNDPQPTEGSAIVYTIQLTNNGPSKATGVVLTDTLPAGITFVASGATQGSYNNGSGVWSVGSLNDGANATLLITATVNAGTLGQTITNTVSGASANQPDPDTGNNTSSTKFKVVTTMHVGDLDGTSVPSGSNKWIATVIITVHDPAHNPTQGVEVKGKFSEDGTGGGGPIRTCITDAAGQCSVSTEPIPKSKPESIYTVQQVRHSSYKYQPGANHDPDGGSSNGTTITIVQGVGGFALPGESRDFIYYLPLITKSIPAFGTNGSAAASPASAPPLPAPSGLSEGQHRLYLPLIMAYPQPANP